MIKEQNLELRFLDSLLHSANDFLSYLQQHLISLHQKFPVQHWIIILTLICDGYEDWKIIRTSHFPRDFPILRQKGHWLTLLSVFNKNISERQDHYYYLYLATVCEAARLSLLLYTHQQFFFSQRWQPWKILAFL